MRTSLGSTSSPAIAIDRALHAGAGLDRSGDRRAIRFAASAREGAVAVRIGLHQECPLVEPEGVERDLEFAVVERPVVGRHHDVDLFGIVAEPDAGLRHGSDEWLLGDREHHGMRMVCQQPANRGDHGVGDVVHRGGQAEPAEFRGVQFRVLGGIVRQEPHWDVPFAQNP